MTSRSNGMVVTPDNSILIIAGFWASKLTAFDIALDGSLSNWRVWAEVGGDGIYLDGRPLSGCGHDRHRIGVHAGPRRR